MNMIYKGSNITINQSDLIREFSEGGSISGFFTEHFVEYL